jgi:hypothetical protein
MFSSTGVICLHDDMNEWIKVNQNKKEDVFLPIVVFDAGVWQPKALCIGLKDLSFEWLPYFTKVLNGKEMGKHLKVALLWYLTEENLNKFAPSLGDENDSSASSAITEASSSKSESGASGSEEDERPLKKKKKAKK